jgi:hypothetical protein
MECNQSAHATPNASEAGESEHLGRQASDLPRCRWRSRGGRGLRIAEHGQSAAGGPPRPHGDRRRSRPVVLVRREREEGRALQLALRRSSANWLLLHRNSAPLLTCWAASRGARRCWGLFGGVKPGLAVYKAGIGGPDRESVGFRAFCPAPPPGPPAGPPLTLSASRPAPLSRRPVEFSSSTICARNSRLRSRLRIHGNHPQPLQLPRCSATDCLQEKSRCSVQ